MSKADNFAYTLQDSDTSVAHVAARYGITDREIWIATASTEKNFKNLNLQEFRERLHTGDTLIVPLPEDPWEWRLITPKTPTLKEFCNKKLEPARVGGPPLTPELLWFHPRNDFFRTRVVNALSSTEARIACDKDPGAAPFEAGEQIFVPYPTRHVATPIKAAPATSTMHSAVVETAPEWITALRAIDGRVEQIVNEIATARKVCEALQSEGQVACCQLAGLHRLILLELEHASADNKALLEGLQKEFEKLQREATDLLFADPAGKLEMPESAQWRSLSKQLLKELRSPHLKELGVRSVKEYQQRIDGASAIEITDRIFTRGYTALITSPLAGEAKADMDDAYVLLPGGVDSTPRSSPGNTAICAFLSAVLSSVGNLPGPLTVAVATVHAYATYTLSNLSNDFILYIKQATTRLDAAKLKGMKLTEIEHELVRGGKFREVADELRKKMLWASALSKEEVVRFNEAIASGDREALREVASIISGKTNSRFPIHVAVSALNIISLLIMAHGALSGDDPLSFTSVLSMLGGSAGSAVGLMQVVASFRPEGACGRMLGTVGSHFGTFSIVTGIVTGAITAFSEEKMWPRIAGAAQMLGGYASVAGLILTCPIAQMLGAVVLVASAALGLGLALNELNVPGAKHVLSAQLAALGQRPVWKKMTEKRLYLQTSLSQVMSTLDDSEHGGLFALAPTPEVISTLRITGFSENDIKLIAPEAHLRTHFMHSRDL